MWGGGHLLPTTPFFLPEVSSWSTDEVECFSDYMTLWVPRSRLGGLKRWLSRVLHPPGTWRGPDHLDSSLAKCGYFLHPTPDGDFIFRVRYSACFVQKETANYRLEIRIFQKGVKRLERSDRYVMKCPRIGSRLGQQSVRCSPEFIQVSRPLPLGSDGGQMPWLLSLRGELVASLEDAGLMGLSVDINASEITVQSPRQDLLQRREVLNTSAELLPLWLVSGSYAYSLEAACPLGSAQPESEVLVHVPKQRLGLVKRGSHIKESLSLRFLRVHQAGTFTVTESGDFVVVSIPAAGLLRVQQCQEARGGPGTRAFYRVDLSLQFAEMMAPVVWTVESAFPCVGRRPTSASFLEGSGTELPTSTAAPRTSPSTQSPSSETPVAGVWSSSAQRRAAGAAAPEGLSQDPNHALAKERERFPQTARPAGGSWTPTASLTPRATEAECGPPAPPGEVGLPGSPPPSATPSLESAGAVQAGPSPPRRGSPDPTALPVPSSSEVPSPPSPPSERPQLFLGSGPSLAPAEGLGAERPGPDPAQPPGSPLLQGESPGQEATAEPVQREPDQASKGLQPLREPPMASLAEEALVPCQPASLPSVGLASPEPSQDTQGLRCTSLQGLEAAAATPRAGQRGTASPDPTGSHRASPAASPAARPAPTSKKPAASSVQGSGRAGDLESVPRGPLGRDASGAAHPSSPPPLQAPTPPAPAAPSPPAWPSLDTHPPLAAGPWPTRR
uniref:Chromosome 1 open reading frame 127 n=1 Tax=Oryctolagus cuniculus TaxID=9986 RepID=G1SWR4_RABIT